MSIEPFDLKRASPQEYAAANTFYNRMRAERLPDDPPMPLDEEIRRLQSIPPVVDVLVWSVWNEDRSAIVAEGDVDILRTDENRHMLEFEVNVLPEFRRRGWARRLLEPIVAATQREERRLMITSTSGNVPAGDMFMQRLGAHRGLATHTNQLDLQSLDRSLLARWQARAGERAGGFDLGLWTDGYPEDEIAAVAAIWEAMNRAPRDTLEIEDFHWTPVHIRQFEARDRARGNDIWAIYARERATERLAGMTEVGWNPNRPEIVEQGMTVVHPEFLNRGLGRWLKAAMLEKVLRERPQARWVRTGNADSNAAMLKINRELGFTPYESHVVWQVETERVRAYLAGASGRTLP